MGGVVNSVGGFLGTSSGPKAPDGNFGNRGLNTLSEGNGIYDLTDTSNALQGYANGGTSQDAINQFNNSWGGLTGARRNEFANALATGATTGSKFAADQMFQNATQNSLYGQNGQLGQVEGKLNDLYNQGFDLKPEDHTMYGQVSGNIARQFGQQGNQAANSLASRGLSNSGAAGATFSGLAGNQNEMLAQAQQGIAQQRFQNTMNQIGQYQNFASNLGGQYNNALQQQYGRQLSGAQNQKAGLQGAAGLQQGANQQQNQYGLQKSQFDVSNTPANFMDYTNAGIGSSLFNTAAAPGTAAQSQAGKGGGGISSMGAALA